MHIPSIVKLKYFTQMYILNDGINSYSLRIFSTQKENLANSKHIQEKINRLFSGM